MTDKGFDSPEDALAAIGVGAPKRVTNTQTNTQKQDVTKSALPPVPSTEDVQERIELKYKFVGTGPDGRPVETIILDNIPRMAKDKVLAIAWSPSLKKEITSMVVPKIETEEE